MNKFDEQEHPSSSSSLSGPTYPHPLTSTSAAPPSSSSAAAPPSSAHVRKPFFSSTSLFQGQYYHQEGGTVAVALGIPKDYTITAPTPVSTIAATAAATAAATTTTTTFCLKPNTPPSEFNRSRFLSSHRKSNTATTFTNSTSSSTIDTNSSDNHSSIFNRSVSHNNLNLHLNSNTNTSIGNPSAQNSRTTKMMTMNALNSLLRMSNGAGGAQSRHQRSHSSTSYFGTSPYSVQSEVAGAPVLPLMVMDDDNSTSNSTSPKDMDESSHGNASSNAKEQQQISSTTAMLESLTATVTPSRPPPLLPSPPSKLFNRQLQSRVHLMVFVKILLQYLVRVDIVTNSDNGDGLATKAKRTVAECHAHHTAGDSEYQNLPQVLEHKLREAIGEFHFTKAQSIHRQAQFRAKRKASWASGGGSVGSLDSHDRGSLGVPSSPGSNSLTARNNSMAMSPQQRHIQKMLPRSGRGAARSQLPPHRNRRPSSADAALSPTSSQASPCSSTSNHASYTVQKKYNTASGLPSCFQLRDAQFFKNQTSDQQNLYWAPNLEELNHLVPGMKVQCTIVGVSGMASSGDGNGDADMSVGGGAAAAPQQEAMWMTIRKVLRKRATDGTGAIRIRRVLVASVDEDYVLSKDNSCDLPANATVLMLPKHIQQVDRRSADVLFERAARARAARAAG